jgi:hypothetical protein
MPINKATRQGPSLSTNNPTAGDRLPQRNGIINFGNNQRLLQNTTKDVIDKSYNAGSDL